MTETRKWVLCGLCMLAVLGLTVDAMFTIHERHVELRAEIAASQSMEEPQFPSDESLARAHRGEAPEFPDPCGLESVVCEGEPGWEEE